MKKTFLYIIASLSFLTSLSAQPIQQLYIFGDSFSDCGNRHIHTNGVEPGIGYHEGRYSNGLLWNERLSEKLGIPAPISSSLNGTNYAYAGAETRHGIDSYDIIHMGSQVDNFLSKHSSVPDNSLVVLWGGGNDYLQMTPGNIVDNLANYTSVLADAGAKEFLIVNLPPIEKGPGTKAILDANLKDWYGQSFFTSMILFASAQHVQWQNSKLADRISQLEQKYPITIHQLNLHQIFSLVAQDPDAYEIKVMDAPAFDKDTKVSVKNPDQHAFFDHIHPSAKMHDLLAKQALNVIQKPLYLLEHSNPRVHKLVQISLENPGNTVQDKILQCPLETSKYLGYARADSTILIKNGSKILSRIPLNTETTYQFERTLDDKVYYFEATLSINNSINPYYHLHLDITDTAQVENADTKIEPADPIFHAPLNFSPKIYSTKRIVPCAGNDFELIVPGQNTTQRIRSAPRHPSFDILGTVNPLNNNIIIQSEGQPIAQFKLGNDLCHLSHCTVDDIDYTLRTHVYKDPHQGNYYIHLDVEESEEE